MVEALEDREGGEEEGALIQRWLLNSDSDGDRLYEKRKVRVSLSLSRELVEEIDATRGLIPRSTLVEALLQLALRRVRRHYQNHTSLTLPYRESPRPDEKKDGYDEYWDERSILTDP